MANAAVIATLRSRPVRVLTATALAVSLLLGGVLLAMQRLEARPARATPMTDQQSMDQVVGHARQFVAAGRLRRASGSYILQSCQPDDGPPYQGSVYLNFDLPTITETPAFFRAIARAMNRYGWADGLPPGHHPGGKVLSKDGATAVYYRHPDVPGRGVLQIYGECRNFADHRHDASGFVDITRSLSKPD